MPGTAIQPLERIRSRRQARSVAKQIVGRASIERGVTFTTNKFAKLKRLLRHADFQRVYQNGRRQFTGNMTVFFLRRGRNEPGMTGTGEHPRVGFTVGKVLGKAVERNRIRRRMREAVRTSWRELEGPVDVIFNPRRSVLNLPYSNLVSEVARGLRLATQRTRVALERNEAGTAPNQ